MSSKYLKHLKEKKKKQQKEERLKKNNINYLASTVGPLQDEMLEKYVGIFLFYIEIDFLPVEEIVRLTQMPILLAEELNRAIEKNPEILIDETLKLLPLCAEEAGLSHTRNNIPFDVRYVINPVTSDEHKKADLTVSFVMASDLNYDIKDIPLKDNPNASTLCSALTLSYLNYYALGLTNHEHIEEAIERIRIPKIYNQRTGRVEEMRSCTIVKEDELPRGFKVSRH